MGPGGGGGGGMSDIFDILSGGGGGGRQRGPRKGEDVVHRLRVSLEELYNGSTRRVNTTQALCTSSSRFFVPLWGAVGF